jgi:hypothetical protein
VLEHLPGDHRGGGLDDGEPVVGVALPAGGDAPPVAQPAVGALDRPAFAAVRVAAPRDAAAAALDHHGVVGGRLAGAAAAADHRRQATLADLLAQRLAVVAAVCPQLARPDLTREQLVEQRQQMPPLILVAGADPDRERDPGRVDDQVEAATGAAAERAADRAAPFFVSTNDASAIARDQSTIPSRSSNTCIRTNSPSQTPARRHSWKRRQHVCPDGHPSTAGSSAHGTA